MWKLELYTGPKNSFRLISFHFISFHRILYRRKPLCFFTFCKISFLIFLFCLVLSGEATGIPLTVHCPNKLGYISLSGITINGTPLTNDQQEKVNDECEKQMKEMEKLRGRPVTNPKDAARIAAGTDCLLTFPDQDINENDVIRYVYRCANSRTSGDKSLGTDTDKPSRKIQEGACFNYFLFIY